MLALIDRLLPHSYLAKLMVIVGMAVTTPLLATGIALLAGLPNPKVFLVSLLGALLAGMMTHVGVRILLAPLGRIDAALCRIGAEGRCPVGPTSCSLPRERDPIKGLVERAERVARVVDTRLTIANRLAERDPLTGLLNRRGLERQMGPSARGTLLMVDLDHFKKVNDRFGHAAGDAVLRKVASLLRSQLRPNDLSARFGGEEFVVFLPNTFGEDALTIAQSLRSVVAGSSFTRGLLQTASIGMAGKEAHNAFATVIEHADSAVYRAKSQGRNRVCQEDERRQGHPETTPKSRKTPRPAQQRQAVHSDQVKLPDVHMIPARAAAAVAYRTSLSRGS